MKRADYTRWKAHQKGKGFSLTELVIVIIIIAILALAVFAGGSAAIRKAKISRATSDLHNFDVALQTYMGSKRDPVKLTNLSPKADFDKVIDGLNPFLPMGYSVESVSLPTSGNIYSSVSSLNVYASEKKDPWDNPYYLLIEAQERNVGCTEYYFTVISAGPGSQADIGGPVDKDDIFLLAQYSNGTVSSHTYSMWKDKQDTTGTPLTVGVTSLSSLSGSSNPRNLGSTAPSNPGGSGGTGGSGGSGGLPGTVRPGGSGGSGGSEPEHTHTWGEWTYVNETTHERTCTADSAHKETAAHTWDSGKITTPATETTTGVKTYECIDCHGTKTDTIPVIQKAYAILYDDGSLVFQRSATPDATKGTVVATYEGFENNTYTSYSSVPWYAKSASITSVSFKDEIKPVSTAYWFYNAYNMTSFVATNLNTSNVTNMSYMFRNCQNLTSLDVSSFNTSKVTNMNSMFYNSLTACKGWRKTLEPATAKYIDFMSELFFEIYDNKALFPNTDALKWKEFQELCAEYPDIIRFCKSQKEMEKDILTMYHLMDTEGWLVPEVLTASDICYELGLDPNDF